jgi:hypothetical protein
MRQSKDLHLRSVREIRSPYSRPSSARPESRGATLRTQEGSQNCTKLDAIIAMLLDTTYTVKLDGDMASRCC